MMAKETEATDKEEASLRQIQLLKYFPKNILLNPRYCIRKKYKNGEEIFRMGAPNNYIHILLEGLVKITVFTRNGDSCILLFVSVGDFFGDIFAQDEEVSAVVKKSAYVISILKSKFKELLQYPEISMQFITMLSCRQKLYWQRVLLKTVGAKERLANATEILSEIINGKHRLTHEEIGQFCFLARETVTRQLLSLRCDNNKKIKGGLG